MSLVDDIQAYAEEKKDDAESAASDFETLLSNQFRHEDTLPSSLTGNIASADNEFNVAIVRSEVVSSANIDDPLETDRDNGEIPWSATNENTIGVLPERDAYDPPWEDFEAPEELADSDIPPDREYEEPTFDLTRLELPELVSSFFSEIMPELTSYMTDPRTSDVVDRLLTLINSSSPDDDQEISTLVKNAIKTLVPKLLEDVTTGGTGIDATVQAALFDAMYERDLQTLRDALDEVEANVARRGFPMPTSMSQASRDAVVQRYTDTKDQRSRDVTVLIAERAQQNVQFATTAIISLMQIDKDTFFKLVDRLGTLSDQLRTRLFQGIDAGEKIEKLKVDYSLGMARAYAEINNAAIAKFKANIDEDMEIFNAKLRRYASQLDLYRFDTGTNVDKEKVKVGLYTDRETRFERRGENYLDRSFQKETKLYDSDMRIDESEFQAKMRQWEQEYVSANREWSAQFERSYNKWVAYANREFDQFKYITDHNMERLKANVAGLQQLMEFHKGALVAALNEVNAIITSEDA